MLSRAAILALASVASASCSTTGRAPTLHVESAEVSVAIATSSPGDSYPVPEECLDGDVLCFRYPLWFTARTIEPVFGTPPGNGPFRVVLYTHYDQPSADSPANPRLVLFLRSGGSIFAIEHMHAQAFRRKDGGYVVPLYDSSPIHWLPCEVHELRERIDSAQFESDISVPLDYLTGEEIDGVFEIKAGTAVPLYGLEIEKIRNGLRAERRSIAGFACPPDAES